MQHAAYVGDRIWDGSSPAVITGKAVLVRDGHVIGVVPESDVPAVDGFADVATMRFPGCTILPGLIDAHTHLSNWMMPAFLSAGITTVRDTGGGLTELSILRAAALSRPESSPRVLGTGPVLDGPTANWSIVGRAHRDVTEIVSSVHELADAGVEAIKLYTNVTRNQMAAATAAAHERGLPVLAHLGSAGTVAARDSGVDEVEHLSGVVPTMVPAGQELDQVAVAAAGAIPWHCTTLVVWDRLARCRDPAFEHDSRNAWVHPDIFSAWRRFPHRTLDSTSTTDRQAAVVAMKRVLRSLLDGGSRLMTGTDTPWPWLVPGWSLHDELALLEDAGVTRLEALRAATSDAATALHREDLGRIAVGASADLLVVEGDPTLRLSDLGRIVHVVRSGHSVDLGALHRVALEQHAVPASAPIDRLLRGFADGVLGPAIGAGEHDCH